MASFKHGVYLIAELALRACVLPRLRARLLHILGARVGRNVRVYECRFINLEHGFSNLRLGDDVHVGSGCLFDLEGPIFVGRGTSLSPRVCLISHSNPGSAHGSPLVDRYPVEAHGIEIGEYCWVGACATLLSGTSIGSRTVIGAMALVKGKLEASALYAGVPARLVRMSGTN